MEDVLFDLKVRVLSNWLEEQVSPDPYYPTYPFCVHTIEDVQLLVMNTDHSKKAWRIGTKRMERMTFGHEYGWMSTGSFYTYNEPIPNHVRDVLYELMEESPYKLS
jgi:hypothetical protein